MNEIDFLKARLDAIEGQLEQIRERQIAESEFRQLGHRVVWNEAGECNLPGVPPLSGEALERQLERQRRFY